PLSLHDALPIYRQFERQGSLSQSPPQLLLRSIPASLFPDRRPLLRVAGPAAQSPPRGNAILRAACFPASARICVPFAFPLRLRVLRFRQPARCSSGVAAFP